MKDKEIQPEKIKELSQKLHPMIVKIAFNTIPATMRTVNNIIHLVIDSLTEHPEEPDCPSCGAKPGQKHLLICEIDKMDMQEEPEQENMTTCGLCRGTGKMPIPDIAEDIDFSDDPDQEERSCDNNCADPDIKDIFRNAGWKECPACKRKIPQEPQDKPKEWEPVDGVLNWMKEGEDIDMIDHLQKGIQLCFDKIDRLTERVKANENDILTREGVEQTLFDKIAELEKAVDNKDNIK